MQTTEVSPVVLLAAFVAIILVLRRFLKHPVLQGSSSPAQRRWELLLNIFGLPWVISQTVFDRLTQADGPLHQFQLPIIAAGIVLGIATIWAFYRWLLAADELIRRIETEAVALALGLSTVGIIAFAQLESAGIRVFAGASRDLTSRNLVMVFLCYGLSRVVTYLRYR